MRTRNTKQNFIKNQVRILFLALITLTFYVSACSDNHFPRTPRFDLEDYEYEYESSEYSSYSATSTGDIDCPNEPNIKPDYDHWRDGSGYFTVCRKPERPHIKLYPDEDAQNNPDTICLFPALYDSEVGVPYPKLDENLIPYSKCFDLNDNGLSVGFPAEDFKFNFMFVIDKKDKEQMEECLIWVLADPSYYHTCPDFSYGHI